MDPSRGSNKEKRKAMHFASHSLISALDFSASRHARTGNLSKSYREEEEGWSEGDNIGGAHNDPNTGSLFRASAHRSSLAVDARRVYRGGQGTRNRRSRRRMAMGNNCAFALVAGGGFRGPPPRLPVVIIESLLCRPPCAPPAYPRIR